MDVRDLRVGNYVKDHNGYECYIASFRDDDMVHIESKQFIGMIIHIHRLKPIPLSKNWMAALGFDGDQITITQGSIMVKERILQCKGFGILSGAFYLNDEFIGNFAYVHQIQNLYYVLKQKDIELKTVTEH